MALRTPTKGLSLSTYNRNMRESQNVQGLRSKLSPRYISIMENQMEKNMENDMETGEYMGVI